MKICQSISSVSRIAAGVSGFLLPLSHALVTAGVEVEILSLEDKYTSEDLSLWHPLRPFLLKNLLGSFGFAIGYEGLLNQINPSIVHQHGLWMYPSYAVLRWCRKYNISRVVSTHGMLEPWAWQHNRWKKEPVWRLWEKSNLQTAGAIHVTSEKEMNGLREMGVTSPIAIIPIGIDIPDIKAGINRENKKLEKTFLFLSRLHPVKGIENLINAWLRVRQPDWRVVIAGPGDPNYIKSLKELVNKLGVQNEIVFHEAVYGKEKWQLIADADVFVLPSFSENFGIVVAEALASGVPVITTRATPWQGIVENNCGWWVDVGVDPLAEALYEATQLSLERLHAMGQFGRAFMGREFTWNESALKMKVLYDWVLGSTNQKPDFVFL